MEPLEDLMTPEEVAHLLRITPKTVREMARSRRLPAIKAGRLWRFDRREVQRWLDAHRTSLGLGERR
jgi:excisionase family DNA binding protein